MQAGGPLKAEVPTQKKDNKDSRRHTSTAENVEMGPIHNRKKRKNTSGKSSVSTFRWAEERRMAEGWRGEAIAPL